MIAKRTISLYGVVLCLFSLMAHGAEPHWLHEGDALLTRSVYEQRLPAADWVLPMGPIERIDGLWQPEQSRALQGQLRRRTLEFSAEKSELQVFKAYVDAMKAQGAQQIYSCQGRDCGQSNNWANRFFKVFQLFGREDSQRLSSFHWLQDGQEHFVLLYLVRRGNQRIYLQQEWLSREAAGQALLLPSENELWKQWQAQGFLRLSQATGQLDENGAVVKPWLDVIASLIKAQQPLALTVVSHDYSAQSAQHSQRMLQSFVSAMEARGLSEADIRTHDMGRLAPLATLPEASRIDILLR